MKLGVESYFKRGDLIVFASGVSGLVIDTFLADQEVDFETTQRIKNWQSIFKLTPLEQLLALDGRWVDTLKDRDYYTKENSVFVRIIAGRPRTVGYTQRELFKYIQRGTWAWSPNKKDKSRRL